MPRKRNEPQAETPDEVSGDDLLIDSFVDDAVDVTDDATLIEADDTFVADVAPEPVAPATRNVTVEYIHVFYGYNGDLTNFKPIAAGEYSLLDAPFAGNDKLVNFLVANQAAAVRSVNLTIPA